MRVASLTAESLREEHQRIREHLEHLEIMAGVLPGARRSEQRKTMQMIGVVLDEHVRAHAAREERVLYPLADRAAGGGDPPFTASMCYEHRVVERWIAELSCEAGARVPDVRAFAHRLDRLLGLLTAHFEEEEQVLLPLLDR